MLTSVSLQKHIITIITTVLYRLNQQCVNSLGDALNMKTLISMLELIKSSKLGFIQTIKRSTISKYFKDLK